MSFYSLSRRAIHSQEASSPSSPSRCGIGKPPLHAFRDGWRIKGEEDVHDFIRRPRQVSAPRQVQD